MQTPLHFVQNNVWYKYRTILVDSSLESWHILLLPQLVNCFKILKKQKIEPNIWSLSLHGHIKNLQNFLTYNKYFQYTFARRGGQIYLYTKKKNKQNFSCWAVIWNFDTIWPRGTLQVHVQSHIQYTYLYLPEIAIGYLKYI